MTGANVRKAALILRDKIQGSKADERREVYNDLQRPIQIRLFSYPIALEMLRSGQLDLSPLISHRFDFENCEEGFKVAKSGKGIKVLIRAPGIKM